jgi:hypothetical protein
LLFHETPLSAPPATGAAADYYNSGALDTAFAGAAANGAGNDRDDLGYAGAAAR